MNKHLNLAYADKYLPFILHTRTGKSSVAANLKVTHNWKYWHNMVVSICHRIYISIFAIHIG